MRPNPFPGAPRTPGCSRAALLACLTACALVGARLEGECGRAAFTLRGEDGFGLATVGLGDLDGDGIAEYAASAPGRPGAGGGEAGRVHVVSGRTASPLLASAEEGAGGGFGRALAHLGTRPLGLPPAPASYLAVGAPCAGAGRGRAIVYAVTRAGADEVFRIEGVEPGELLDLGNWWR